MPKERAPQIRAWSYSRWRTYDDCPARARYAYIDKIATEEETSPALTRGSDIHDQARAFVVGERGEELPSALELFSDEFAILKRAWANKTEDVFLEEQWAFDTEWQSVEWFAPNAWARVVLDAVVADWPDRRMMVIDHKTGRVRPEYHESQLSLYAIAAFSRFAVVERVHAALWYLDHGKAHFVTYERPQLEELKNQWAERTRKMLADRVFEPRPSAGCQWCPYSKSKGGPCQY